MITLWNGRIGNPIDLANKVLVDAAKENDFLGQLIAVAVIYNHVIKC